MHYSTENIILIGSILLIASILASKTSFKLGIPVLILFLGIGMLAVSEGIGGIYFDDPHAAQLLGIVALNLILFSGIMDEVGKCAARNMACCFAFYNWRIGHCCFHRLLCSFHYRV